MTKQTQMEPMPAAEYRALLGSIQRTPIGSRCLAALEERERLLAEAARLAGMPKIKEDLWGVVSDCGLFGLKDDRKEAVETARLWNGPGFSGTNWKAVRLAVVEVAEPEREVQPSGFWYRRAGPAGAEYVEAMHGNKVALHIYRSADVRIPPADRALVARLLGEVADG